MRREAQHLLPKLRRARKVVHHHEHAFPGAHEGVGDGERREDREVALERRRPLGRLHHRRPLERALRRELRLDARRARPVHRGVDAAHVRVALRHHRVDVERRLVAPRLVHDEHALPAPHGRNHVHRLDARQQRLIDVLTVAHPGLVADERHARRPSGRLGTVQSVAQRPHHPPQHRPPAGHRPRILLPQHRKLHPHADLTLLRVHEPNLLPSRDEHSAGSLAEDERAAELRLARERGHHREAAARRHGFHGRRALRLVARLGVSVGVVGGGGGSGVARHHSGARGRR
mmetsp:Transcript_648/g.2368  ORF Transcript_648/g.2368 Transcript_648/m.2368 type:complete len:288 (-) Transcript_648:213-1076(-)